MNANPFTPWSQRLQPLVRGFHAYATWLVGITWKRFIVLSLLLMILAGILQSMPPFSWTMREVIEEHEPAPPSPPSPPSPRTPRGEGEPVIRIETSPKGSGEAAKGVDIRIDSQGVRVIKRTETTAPAAPEGAPPAAPGASSPSSAPSGEAPAGSPPSASPREIRVDVQRDADGKDQASIRVTLPENVDAEAVRAAIEEAKQAVKEALREPAIETVEGPRKSGNKVRISRVHTEDFLTDLAALWILASIIIKLTYKGQLQARAQAAQATEMAEAESLKRQLAEARMATMQAQVEPHFLFNTLASIEHLIETDPPKAGRMQRALIDLLRATMPTLRDGGVAASRTLGQEQAVIEPYLSILKIRMDDRLETSVDIPEGLHSAECPPMVLQMLVENAIKHGLEPKPEGGLLQVQAAVVDGDLQLTVSDSGVGLGAGWQDSSGTGLKNIRERLALRYGAAAQLVVEPREGGGARVVVRLPYRVVGSSPTPPSA
jgi:hypothetical protein